MKKSQLLGAVCACMFISFTNTTNAALISFEGAATSIIPVTPAISYESENTYARISNRSWNDIPNSSAIYDATAPGVNTNGTDIFGVCGDCGEIVTLNINSRLPGIQGHFGMVSIDINNLNLGDFTAGMAVTATGYKYDTTQVQQTFNLVQDTWTTFYFDSSFNDLRYVQLAANGNQISNFALDNIQVDVIPIPPSVWLFGSGLLGLIGIARKKST